MIGLGGGSSFTFRGSWNPPSPFRTFLPSHQILTGVSGKVEAGELMAIQGTTGSGKSTLLDVIAGWKNEVMCLSLPPPPPPSRAWTHPSRAWTHQNTCSCRPSFIIQGISGTVLVNGKPRRTAQFKHISGYVQQHDTILGTLTVRESLMFSAEVRV